MIVPGKQTYNGGHKAPIVSFLRRYSKLTLPSPVCYDYMEQALEEYFLTQGGRKRCQNRIKRLLRK